MIPVQRASGVLLPFNVFFMFKTLSVFFLKGHIHISLYESNTLQE